VPVEGAAVREGTAVAEVAWVTGEAAMAVATSVVATGRVVAAMAGETQVMVMAVKARAPAA